METYLIHTEKAQLRAIKPLLKALKVNIEKVEKPYNAEFVKKIEASEQDFKAGRTTKISLDDIWKSK
jgi:translation initiation factor 2B subunit (eIF-2B alpha/beta/delta family)